VSLLIFLATNALPGSVSDIVLGKNATPDRVASMDARLGLDQPLLVRYGQWLGDFVQGNLGESAVKLASGAATAPISIDIADPVRNTVVLALLTAVLLFPVALVVGAVSGVKEGKATDYFLSYTALVLGSMPEFVIGAFLISIFFSQLHLLPPVALIPPGGSPLDNVQSLMLPILTLLAVCVSLCARQIRAGVAEVMRAEYVTSARLNGIRERTVLRRYVLRNSLAVSIQTYANTLQYLLGGIVVVEALFAYPGIGQMLVNAVQARDFTVVQAIALLLAAAFIAINILADLIVVFLVPKLRTGVK
jgi:peptide/nickel transport system permease protein